MRNYQKLLLDALQQNHWSLDEVLKPENWWAAENLGDFFDPAAAWPAAVRDLYR
jgi:hypothetical protein